MKGCSISLVTREIQIQTTTTDLLEQHEFKTLTTPSIGEAAEELEFSQAAGWWECRTLSTENKLRHVCHPVTPLQCLLKRNGKHMSVQRLVHKCYNSFLCNSPK